ncbi:hypothetical protein GCM10017673_35080 [Streptosporangium violaceochromogenes]|nr:hypothetical protein GCM10017673_35080 [Streptosporangium violaceochromogenes]
MIRYIYSIIRCLPDPRTGEFVNYGAIAGSPVTGDWDVRRLSRTDRIHRFAASVLNVASDFTLRLEATLDARRAPSGSEPLDEEWLRRPHHRNDVSTRRTRSSAAWEHRFTPWTTSTP